MNEKQSIFEDEYIYHEKDVDMEAVNELCRTHTAEELDAEWEQFKKAFQNERND